MANRDLGSRSASDLRALRSRPLTGHPVQERGEFVLYWMTRQHRLHANQALEFARDRARALAKPLLILESIGCDEPHAADRHHYFVCQGMLEHRRVLADRPVGYLCYVEREPGVAGDLVRSLVATAAEVVTDDSPGPPIPDRIATLTRAAEHHRLAATAIDANGVLPTRLLEDPCPTAAVFRRYVHKHLAQALSAAPQAHPLSRIDDLRPFPQRRLDELRERWGDTNAWLDHLEREPHAALNELPIDHEVPLIETRGGRERGRRELRNWIEDGLARYGERSDPTSPAASNLSPYLRWGMLSPFEIIDAISEAEGGLDLEALGAGRTGAKTGFWPFSEPAQSYLDELVTWRELGYHTSTLRPDDYHLFHSLPDWALETLAAHRDDEREHHYGRDRLEAADTSDELWNAAQRQLLRDGHIHNYLRMLWGKRAITWRQDPQDAYHDLIHLNNRWALDGCDPNSWSGVLWCFGRYDRPWQERPIYGKVRTMTSASTRKKFDLGPYLERYGP